MTPSRSTPRYAMRETSKPTCGSMCGLLSCLRSNRRTRLASTTLMRKRRTPSMNFAQASSKWKMSQSNIAPIVGALVELALGWSLALGGSLRFAHGGHLGGGRGRCRLLYLFTMGSNLDDQVFR